MKIKRKINLSLLCGILGCICFATSDWLMIYGDTAYVGSLSWLTAGTVQIASWRNSLAMALAFPGIILYGIALFAIAVYIKKQKQRKIYSYLTAFSLTPWLCLHLLYILILYGFAWMSGNGYEAAALPVSEALFDHLSWIVIVSEALMLPPYLYWFWKMVVREISVFPRWMALSNPLLFYVLLKLLTMFMPDGAFRLAFTNGLMSESMLIWFGSMLLWNVCHKNNCLEENNGEH